MHVRFAGGLHYDPTSRRACIEFMKTLSAESKPVLVAVEWDSGIVAKLEAEREDFKRRWARFREQDPPELVEQLAKSIAWESDVFKDVFGDLPVVWLEDGRGEPPSTRPLGSNRRLDCEYALAPDPKERPTADVLPRLHRYWLEDAEVTQKKLIEDGRDSSRDKAWEKNLAPSLDKDGWALVIVGAIHASDWDDETLFNLLIAGGHRCDAGFLVWKPTPPTKK